MTDLFLWQDRSTSSAIMKKELTLTIIAVVATVGFISTPSMVTSVYGQNDTQTTLPANATGGKPTTYILVFGNTIIGNIDNDASRVSSIVSTNVEKIREEFVEDLSLQPSEELIEQVNGVVDNAVNGMSCDTILTTEAGSNAVDCISSDNFVIWYLYPVS